MSIGASVPRCQSMMRGVDRPIDAVGGEKIRGWLVRRDGMLKYSRKHPPTFLVSLSSKKVAC